MLKFALFLRTFLLKLASTKFYPLERKMRTEIWKLSLPPVSELEPGEDRIVLGFVDWDTGTRNFLRHTSKSLMLYHPKGVRADI